MDISIPDNTRVGDLLVATITVQADAVTVTAPMNWVDFNSQSNGITQESFYKVALTGDIGTSATFTYNATAASSGGIVDISNVHTAMPIDGTDNHGATGGTSITAGGVTTNFSNDLLFAAFSIAGTNAVSFSLSPALTPVYQVFPTGGPNTTVGFAVQATAGASATYTANAITGGAHAGTIAGIVHGP